VGEGKIFREKEANNQRDANGSSRKSWWSLELFYL
jgi:hypothetical protein